MYLIAEDSMLNWLYAHSEPEEQLLDYWSKTHTARKGLLLIEKLPINDYLDKFLSLNLQLGKQLVRSFFKLHY